MSAKIDPFANPYTRIWMKYAGPSATTFVARKISASATTRRSVAFRSLPREPAKSRCRALATLETTTPFLRCACARRRRTLGDEGGGVPAPSFGRRRYWPTLNWLWNTHVAGVPFEAQKAMVAEVGSPFLSNEYVPTVPLRFFVAWTASITC